MTHAIEVQLGANIDKYKAGMEAAKRTGTESMGFIATIFDKIKTMFSGLWDSFKSFFSSFGDKSKSTFDSMSSSASSAFQKLSGHFSGLNSDLDKTNGKMSETEQQSDSLTKKIGIGLVAAFVAVTAVVGGFVAKGLMVDSTFAGIATSSDLAVSQISRFDAAAARSGVGIKDLGAAMAKFRDEMKNAAAGDGSDEFSKLGVKVADSNNALRKTDDVMIDVAKKIAGMSSEAEKYAAASKLGFDGKVQVLEDIAHASDLSARVTDEQAAAATRLGKIWHEILPSSRSMWAEISDKLANAFTPAMTTASVAVLESKNRIVSAFDQIYGGGSMFDKLATKIQGWSQDASKWFAGVTKSATEMTVSLMQYIALKTGLGNPDALKPNGAGFVPGQVPLVSGKNAPIVSEADKKAQEAAKAQYDQLTKSILEKINAQQLEAETGAALTDGQRTALQLMGLLRDGNLDLTDAQKIAARTQLQTLIDLEKANKQMLDGKATAEAAAKKEAEAYATLMATIQDKLDQDALQLSMNDNLTDSQKLMIKLDSELASGKLKLSDAHIAAAKAKLREVGASEDLLKVQTAQKEVAKYIESGIEARNKSVQSLQLEYQMYGKSADARAIAMVAVESEASMQAKLNELYEKHLPVSEATIERLNAERDARTAVGQATLGQTQALQYAAQLAQENKQFVVDVMLDDKQRAAAQLALDSQVWQGKIANAGAGTEAQRRLQEQFDQWYANQSIKPRLDEEKQLWDSIGSAAHDTFISIQNGAKSAGQRAKEALKNGLFEWLWQLAAKPIYLDVRAAYSSAGSLLSAAGPGAPVGAASSSPLVTAANVASSLYGAVTGGMTLSGGLGTGFMGSLAGGLNGAGVGSGLTSSIGLSIGNSIADVVGPSVAGAISTGLGAVATALPWIGAAVAAVSIGKLAFGMGSKQTTSQGMSGTLSADSLTGSNYANWTEKGGWFRSDKHGTDTTAFSAQTVTQLTQGLSAIEQAASGFAKSLGVDAGWVSTYSKAFDLTLTGDATKDAQVVADFFNGIGDEIAKKLVPNLDQFSKSGETASATLQRLAAEFQGTDQVAQLLGTSAAQLFGSAGFDSAKARENLINAAGGLDVLNQQATAFNQNFLTDAERMKPVADALNAALGSLGLDSIPTTRDQFAALVVKLRDSGAAATESGAAQLAALLALAPAFAQVHPAIEATAAAATMAADAFTAMKDAASGLTGDVDSAMSVLQKVAQRQKAAIQAQIDAQTAAVSKLTSLSQALHGTLDSMAIPDQSEYDRAAAQAQVKTALAIAKAGGPLPDADSLKTALSALQKDSTGQFSSYADYLKDFYTTKNDIASLAGVTDDSLSVEQKSLDALSAQIKAIDDLVARAQDQVDVLKGIDTNGLTLIQAVEAVRTAILAAQANPVVAATTAVNQAYQSALGRAPDAAGLAYWQQQAASGVSVDDIRSAITMSPEATIQGMYQTMLHRPADAAGLNFWLTQLQNGVSMADIGNAIAGSGDAGGKIPGFAGGGDHTGGLRWVGELSPELEATGASRIHSTQSLIDAMRTPAGNNDAVAAEVKSLRLLAEKQQQALDKIANSTERHASMFENATGNGGPLLVEIAQ